MPADKSLSAMVVVGGSDIHHDLIGAALSFQSILTDAGIRTRRAVGLERFNNQRAATTDTDVFVLYTAGGSLVKAEQQGFARAIAAGKGVVAVHASIVFNSEPGYEETRSELLGSHYVSHGPDGVEGHYKVEIVRSHPITANVSDFEIDDEFYYIELLGVPKPEVLVQRQSSVGPEPILYVRAHGKGRVCYLSLGHDMRAWGNPSFRSLLSQATLWAGGSS